MLRKLLSRSSLLIALFRVDTGKKREKDNAIKAISD